MSLRTHLRGAVTGLAVAALVGLAACDWGPSGEGDLRGTVAGPNGPFAAAVLMVSGEGVVDVAGEGGVRAWSRRTGDDELRVVLLQTEESGTLHFRIRVQDVGGPTPSVALLELAGLDDEPVQVTDEHRLRIAR